MLDKLAVVWWLAVGAATVAALAASLYLVFAPAYAGTVAEMGISAGSPTAGYYIPDRPGAPSTLADVNGSKVYLILLVPVVLAAFPMFLRTFSGRAAASAASALFLVGFVMLTGFSIGALYRPAVLFAIVGTLAGGVGAFWSRRPAGLSSI